MEILNQWPVVAMLVFVSAISIGVLLADLRRNNREITGLMRWVWILTVAYSGLLGLAVYFYSGRKQIPRDTLWRRAFRSVAHCYSGCGAGEIAGLTLTVGVLGLKSTPAVALITFGFAYAFGFALTAGPLLQDGVPFPRAMQDAFISDTASITAMEISAIGVDLWLAPAAGIHQAIFWTSLIVSLSFGLLVAYPVNVALIRLGVKEGMHSPAEASSR